MPWNKVKFGDVVEINPTVSLKRDGAYSFIEMADLSDGQKFTYPSVKKVLTGGARFQERDTLFARITPCLENGKICQAKNLENGIGFGSTEFLVFRGKEGISDTDFVFYLSRTDYVRKYAEQNLVGTSGRQRVSANVFYDLEINFPDLPTQTRIATILSAFDDKIELNRQMNHTLEQMAQALFKKYFADDIDKDNLPDGWRMGKLGELIFVQNGYAFKSSDFRDEGLIGIIKIRNINDKIVDVESTQFVEENIIQSIDRKFKVEQGDILIAMTGAEVGKIGIVPATLKSLWLNQRVGSFKEKVPYSSFYNFLLLTSNENQELLQNTALGSAQPNISGSNIENLSCLIPPQEVLSEFGLSVKSMFEKMIANLGENKTLSDIRDSSSKTNERRSKR